MNIVSYRCLICNAENKAVIPQGFQVYEFQNYLPSNVCEFKYRSCGKKMKSVILKMKIGFLQNVSADLNIGRNFFQAK
ncbi:hypothetical protein DRP05_02470 [Archaeoglobales archaeon]|nr:MAG: hypothetical protein DRP05_02470 [Archaeoglobales archaeon]